MDNTAESYDPNGLPSWLTAGDLPKPKPSPIIEQFEIVLPRVLELICGGATLRNAMRELPIVIDSGAFIRWLKRKPDLYDLYKEAKEVRTEVWTGNMLDHATSSDSLEDVNRSRLIVDTYWKLVQAENRKTYGDTKTVEVTGGISITAAIKDAQARVLSIEDMIDVPVLGEGRQE